MTSKPAVAPGSHATRDNRARASVGERVKAADWSRISADLDAQGYAPMPVLLRPQECVGLAQCYADEPLFRSRVVMSRHGFGRGEYQYFDYPLPALIAQLRDALYPNLRRIANRWNERLGLDARYPPRLREYLDRCHRAGQRRPTPLLLKYGPGDYNCLHQDLYGQHLFPLQVAVLLSRPGQDFEGGEFILTEQRPRRQSRATVVPLRQGDAVVFAVNQRPVRKKGSGSLFSPGTTNERSSRDSAKKVNLTPFFYRVRMRHGVSEVRAGARYTAGIIFHDAE